MRIITKLLSNPSSSMRLMDPYGNFVIHSSLQRAKRASTQDDKGNPIIRDYYSSPLTASGNTHDDMLLAKLETVKLVLVTLVLQCFSGGLVVGNFPPHEAFVLGGTNSFPGMNIWSNGENDQTSSSKS
ncbi:hypothetical protein RDI58_027054 [Solanum bulbocastanum]|uniref:Uncharacterized protein n=1 Tax=Solanum bulbocastanum TaxID=147425 RepID=A0AAN8Y3Y3_SOLBU